MYNGWIKRVKILDRTDALPQVLSCHFLIKSALLLEQTVYLSFGTELKNKVKVFIVFIVVMKLQNMVMVQLVHYFNLKFNLLH